MKDFSHLVITAGISAISERNALGRLLRANPGTLIFPERQQNPVLRDGTTEQAEQHARECCCTKEALAAVAADPKSVSAEYSLLHALRGMGSLHDKPTVVLLHTDTLAGRISAQAVAGLIEPAFSATCRLRPIASLDTSNQRALQAGLGAFMHQVVNELREVDPSYACFAPQGGYKVMTSLGYVAGSFLGYSTAYLHEDNQALHIIPPIPISLSAQEKEALGKLARSVERTQEFSKLTTEEQDEVLVHPWLFEVSDDLVVPNALAQFLGLDTQPIFLSPEAHAVLNESHRAARIRGKLRELPGMLRARQRDPGAYVNILDHERDFTNLNRPGNQPAFHIWKAVKGEIYIAWKVREDGAALINRIWADNHAAYVDAGDHARPANSKGLFDEPSTIAWAPLKDDTDSPSVRLAPREINQATQPSASAEVATLKAKVKTLYRENSASQQNAAKFRKEAAKLSKERTELENQVQNLRMRLAALTQE